jgi:muramoyltetrapeptide carboxypeptidase
LVGGNLALLCSVLGTPYEFPMQGRILLLEDIGEQPYRLDRLLDQLNLAGHLRQLSGILLGQFTNCQPAEGKPSLTLQQVFSEHLGDLGIPVLQGFPTGHAVDNVTLPLGALVEMDTHRLQVQVLENPVRL